MVALLGIATEIRETAWRHDRQLYQNKFDHVEAGRDARIGTCILDRRQVNVSYGYDTDREVCKSSTQCMVNLTDQFLRDQRS
jgi:hypothetical protein